MWQLRKQTYKRDRTLCQPKLTFSRWMQERDYCRDHKGDRAFRSEHFLFNIAFFCNTNRMWDKVSEQLQEAIRGHQRHVQVGTIVLLRFAGSPRNEEKQGRSGAASIATRLAAQWWPTKYVETMPFTGRRTYRAVMNRRELAIIGAEAVTLLSATEVSESLVTLRDHVAACVHAAAAHHVTELADMRARTGKAADNTKKALEFHALQIACDLHSLKLVQLSDNGASCPLATGSASGTRPPNSLHTVGGRPYGVRGSANGLGHSSFYTCSCYLLRFSTCRVVSLSVLCVRCGCIM